MCGKLEWKGQWLGLLASCLVFGCAAVPNGPAPVCLPADPFVEELVKEEALLRKPDTAILRPDLIFREIPIQTPVTDARSIMERHGFKCWSGVADARGTCLQCTYYKPKTQYLADRVTVKIFYEARRIINAEVVVDYEVRHDPRGYWATVLNPVPPAPLEIAAP